MDEISPILDHVYELAAQVYESVQQVLDLFHFQLGGREKI